MAGKKDRVSTRHVMTWRLTSVADGIQSNAALANPRKARVARVRCVAPITKKTSTEAKKTYFLPNKMRRHRSAYHNGSDAKNREGLVVEL